jgi:hypothetical protein
MTNDIQKAGDALLFGEGEDVRAISKRIKTMVKGGEKLQDNEALALAQVSLVTRLNPFIGEVWYIPGKGPMVGIAGVRRLNNEQAQEKGGYSSEEYVAVDREEAGVPKEIKQEDIAGVWKCIIDDSTSTKEYLSMLTNLVNTLREAKVDDPFGEAKKVLGIKPTWIGYGYSTKSETSRMNKQQLAKKRAEADALKKKVLIPFGGDVSIEEVNPSYVVDAEVKELSSGKVESEPVSTDGIKEPPVTTEVEKVIVEEEPILTEEEKIQKGKSEIITLCTELGGSKNKDLMKILKSFESSGNPNRINDFGKLTELHAKLVELQNKKENK